MTIREFMSYWNVKIQSTKMKPSISLDNGYTYSMTVIDISAQHADACAPSVYLFPLWFADNHGVVADTGESWAERVLLGMAFEASYAASFWRWMFDYVQKYKKKCIPGMSYGQMYIQAENIRIGVTKLFGNHDPKYNTDFLYSLARKAHECAIIYTTEGHHG